MSRDLESRRSRQIPYNFSPLRETPRDHSWPRETSREHSRELDTTRKASIHRQFLSDSDILASLPRSIHHGNATRLEKCTWVGCVAISSSGCRNLCTKHFCELYRNNLVDIEQKTDNRKSQSRHFDSKPNRRAKLPSRDIVESAENSIDSQSASGKSPHKTRRSLKRCVGPMCFNMTSSKLCCECQKKCSSRHSSGATSGVNKPKRKCPCRSCANEATKSTTGLCRMCYDILNEVNSFEEPLPRGDVR